MSSSRLSAGWTRCGLRRGTASDLSTCCDTQSGRRLRSRGYTERAALQRSSRTSGCRAFKLRSGTTAPHRPDDPRPTSARQPAAARLVSRAPCPDPLPQHVPRPHHEPLLGIGRADDAQSAVPDQHDDRDVARQLRAAASQVLARLEGVSLAEGAARRIHRLPQLRAAALQSGQAGARAGLLPRLAGSAAPAGGGVEVAPGLGGAEPPPGLLLG